MDKELEEFKQKFIKGYVDPYLDRLLDLRNIIKNATTYEEITIALDNEKNSLKGIVETIKNE
jgi:hypothetical protein